MMVVGVPQGVFLVALVLSRTFALPQPPVSSNDFIDYEDNDDANIFVRQTRKHARPMFYINCGYRDLCYCYSKITRHHYCCSCEVGACFPGSAQVSTATGEYTSMKDLKTGDEVLAVDDSGKVVTSSVLGFMDRRPNERALYVTLSTATGQNLTLSPNHVLFKSSPNSSHPVSSFGSDINIGDMIFSVNETGIERSQVVAIEHNIIKGAYVPLTTEGTLVIDGALTSCYASYHHSTAHSFLAPVRAFPVLLWPRPGTLSNIGLILMNFIKAITQNGLEFLRNLLIRNSIIGHGHLKVDEDTEVIFTNGDHHMECPTYKSDCPAHTNACAKESVPWSFSLEHTEGEGEAYYITCVKIIGKLFFREERDISQVIQVNPHPHSNWLPQVFSFPSSFNNWHSILVNIVPKPW